MLLCTDSRRIQVCGRGAEPWFPVETLVQEPKKSAAAKQHAHHVHPSHNVSQEKR